MKLYFLDTNILLRHLLNDDAVLSPRARDMLAAIEQGSLTAWTSELVIAEVVFVLSGKRTYNMTPSEIAQLLLPIIRLPHLKLPRNTVFTRAFALYTGLPIDYIDAYNAALMQQRGTPDILSFDTDFDRLPALTRHTVVPADET